MPGGKTAGSTGTAFATEKACGCPRGQWFRTNGGRFPDAVVALGAEVDVGGANCG